MVTKWCVQAKWLELAREVQLLSTCQHDCLLPLLGFCLDPRAACLVYPLCSGGSLEDRLLLLEIGTVAEQQRLQRLHRLGMAQLTPLLDLAWHQRLRLMRDAMRGLLYLHTPSGESTMLLLASRHICELIVLPSFVWQGRVRTLVKAVSFTATSSLATSFCAKMAIS